MKELVPFFELNNKCYEIKKTRWLLAEYDKMTDRSELSAEDKANGVKAQAIMGDIKKYAQLTQTWWDKFTESFDDEDEKKYLKAKSLYDNAVEQLTKLETETGSTDRLQKAGINLLEKIAIKGLAEQYFDFDETKAECVWVEYVSEIGRSKAIEWLENMSVCLFEGDDEENENDFLSQMRKRAEEKALNRKNGLKMVK